MMEAQSFVFLFALFSYSVICQDVTECLNCACCDEGKDVCLRGGQCTSCLDGVWGGKCKTACPTNCIACEKEAVRSGDGNWPNPVLYHVCTKCIDGKYLGDTNETKTCEMSCPTECLSCTSLRNCVKCKTGYGLDNGYCQTCKTGCNTCSSYSQCTSCNSGYYGEGCEKCSEGCQGGVCNQTTGKCVCKSRFNGTLCDQCADSFYGPSCEMNCPETCSNRLCSHETGFCFSCVNTNITGNYCDICVGGLYGNDCKKSCPENCNDDICVRATGNCNDCKGNFAGTKCEACNAGRFGADCTMNCPTNCVNNTCTKEEGGCEGCIKNFDGKFCNMCRAGYYTENCSLLCQSSNCLENICNRNTGLCKACERGWYGEFCNKSCSSGCKHGNCSTEDGICTGGCTDQYSGDKCCVQNGQCRECASPSQCTVCDVGYFGNLCQNSCSINCQNGCSKSSGECKGGCRANYYGTFCNNSCPTSCFLKEGLTKCDGVSGTCLAGCTAGKYGDFCSQSCIKVCDNGSCDQKEGNCPTGSADNVVGLAAGLAAGSAAVILCVVVSVVCYRKRRKLHRKSNADDGHAYANSFDASLRHSVKNVAETIEAEADTTHIPVKKKTESKHKSEELEDPSEEITDEEPDYATASDKDAYYNVTLKIKVSELYGYVTRKSIEQYHQEFKLLPKELSKPYTYARKPENIKKNRYAGIYPYDETRVTVTGDSHFFINANYMRGYKKEKGYIASLGPTKVATEDFQTFWKMVWHEKSDVIVMLTNLQELSGMKCERYWPTLEHPESYSNITVTCQSEDILAEYTVRTFTISQKKETRTLTQFHFTAWPDKGVPDHVVSLVEFWQRVKSLARRTGGPDIVHCSAGIGRTGTFIAIDRLTQEGKAVGYVNVYGCILDMREQRVSMLQTQEQFIYLHQALVYTLVLECEAVRAETFHQHVDTLTSASFAHCFQLLQKTVEDERDDEKDARARNARNTAMNRAGADVPGDLNRPRLHFNKSFNEPDYTNATFINGLKRKNAFIVAQTPLPASLEDFVTLLYQEECPCIVSLEDEPFNRKDVGVYLPADNQSLTVGHFTLTSTRCESKPKYLMRKLTIQYADKAKEKKTMHHFQYTGWQKDKHTPEDPQQFLQFINDVKWKAATGNAVHDNNAILVHCLNAYSRSGLFCTVAVVTEKLQAENQVSIPNTIRQIRTRRNGVITNKDQLEFCYLCATVYLDQFATYTNFSS